MKMKKMRHAKAISGMGEGREENSGGVNSTMILHKNFCKCHNVQYNNMMIKKF
jgi:hypothetical protein